jgi:transcriptional regulator with PAS, ATPase and Fis domain
MNNRNYDKFKSDVLERCDDLVDKYREGGMKPSLKAEVLKELSAIAAELGVQGSGHSPTPESMLVYYYLRFSLLSGARKEARAAFENLFRWVFEEQENTRMLVHWTLRLEEVWDAVRGKDEPEPETVDDIRLRAESKAPLLLVGETGAGKESMARSIHKHSGRPEKAMLVVNCAAIPEGTAESELFGHEKGAFTGAHKMRKGIIERADKGTLFLDEVAKMPTHMQAKLLRVLDDGKVRRMGGDKDVEVDVRFVAAVHPTNLKDGSLLPDLKYRLGYPDVLEVKPLRDLLSGDKARAEDILREVLTDVLVGDLGRVREEAAGYWMTKSCIKKLMSHRFPGNYRELRSALRAAARRAVARGDKRLKVKNLALDEVAPDEAAAPRERPSSISEAIEAGKERRAEVVAEAVERLVRLHGSLRNALSAEGVEGNAYHVVRREIVAATGRKIGELAGRGGD